MAGLSILAKFVKNVFYLAGFFFNLANVRYLFLLMSVICLKGNEAVTISDYTTVWFTINSPLKMLPRHFRYFHSLHKKMKFSIKGFFGKCYQISSFLRIWSHLLNKILNGKLHFLYSDCSNFKMTFEKNFMKKRVPFFNFL